MGTRGPLPKPGKLRQRTNKSPTAATLPSVEQAARNRVPRLPNRPGGWHFRVLDWWRSVWKSPMASEYLPSDLSGLYLLAALYQARWTTEDPRDLVALSKEIRMQEARYGLSPTCRRRLQWTVDQGERAEERRKSRKPDAAADPRDVLKAL